MDSYKVILQKRNSSPEDWTSNTVRLTHIKDNEKLTPDSLYVILPKEKILEEGINAIIVNGFDGIVDGIKIVIASVNGDNDNIFILKKENSDSNNIYKLPSVK